MLDDAGSWDGAYGHWALLVTRSVQPSRAKSIWTDVACQSELMLMEPMKEPGCGMHCAVPAARKSYQSKAYIAGVMETPHQSMAATEIQLASRRMALTNDVMKGNTVMAMGIAATHCLARNLKTGSAGH